MASTMPPNVTAAQATKNSTKKLAPSTSRARCETGFSGSSVDLLETQVDHLLGLGRLLDDAVGLEHAHGEVDERLVVLGVIGLVRRAVLPRDVSGRLGEGVARL